MKEQMTTLYLPYGSGQKRVRVFVPEHEEGEKLPVVYMTDGQNLFEDDNPGQFGCWYTREAVRAELEASGKSAIIVGIHNDEGPVPRTNELTPASIGNIVFPDEIPPEARTLFLPMGEVFDDFVVNTVMPAVEKEFDVKPGRENTAFCGSSSGGLHAYFTALSHPDRFCISGVFSPALMLYSVEDIMNWTQKHIDENAPFLYIYSGAADPLEQQICEVTEQVYDKLMECYPYEKMTQIILPDNPHNERSWAPIFRDFLHTFLTRKEEF